MPSTPYKLRFSEKAAKEWRKLDPALKAQFAGKLKERMAHPRVAASALHGMRDCYRIKLRDAGYRLVYKVYDAELVVLVIAIGRRDGDAVYKDAKRRIDERD